MRSRLLALSSKGIACPPTSANGPPFGRGLLVTRYLVLLRGINVGSRNKVKMAPLRELLGELGFPNVATYIASSNVVLNSEGSAAEIKPPGVAEPDRRSRRHVRGRAAVLIRRSDSPARR